MILIDAKFSSVYVVIYLICVYIVINLFSVFGLLRFLFRFLIIKNNTVLPLTTYISLFAQLFS